VNRAIGKPQPLFLQRIHDRERGVADKRKAEAAERAEERKRLTLLALDLALVALKASQRRPACGHRGRRPKKDVWSRIGDFVFGD
jgi:hypothetical protein